MVPPHILEIFTEREKRPKGSKKNRGGGRNNYELPHNSKKKLLKKQQLKRGEKESRTQLKNKTKVGWYAKHLRGLSSALLFLHPGTT
jgi:hypothetical protein